MGPPLVVGDFNLPAECVNPTAPPAKPTKQAAQAWERKELIRTDFLKNMLGLGYVRHAGPDGTCPATTLKAFGSLAAGEAYPSQPYDGAYEPCGYLAALCEVASGVVLPGGLIRPELYGEEIEGHAPSAQSDLDPDKDEEEDESADADASQDMDLHDAGAPPKKKTNVAEAFGVEIGRVYRGFLRGALRAIADIGPWLVKAQAPKTTTRVSKYKTNATPADLIVRLQAIEAIDEAALVKEVDERVAWFIELVKTNTPGDYEAARGPKGPSLLRRLHELLHEAAPMAKKELNDSVLEDTAAKIGRARLQADNLEKSHDVRRLIGYRAVVSDHLPQLVEIDLSPG
jgi:hypothetical protein